MFPWGVLEGLMTGKINPRGCCRGRSRGGSRGHTRGSTRGVEVRFCLLCASLKDGAGTGLEPETGTSGIQEPAMEPPPAVV